MASEMPRMIGDFNDNANALWSLHVKEAMSHDEARVQSTKSEMDNVLLFVRVYIPIVIVTVYPTPSSCTVIQAGLFSIALTSFLVDKLHDLQVDPAQQMVYYQQQNVALLAQISKQVSSIAPQVSIPSTPPPPYPDFTPNPSDVRVNVFWFLSLVFSISAALLATLVQQWVRSYMHVFRRYSNPLKSTRLRQYLYEGAEGWYMPVVAESVPGIAHVSLFLFLVGLGDSLFAVHTTVGITTIVPITICGLLYVLSTFSPVIKPQSPFRSPFSNLIWLLKQKVHPRSYLDRESGGSLKAVSPNMLEGQIQLAMEENDGRKHRDVRAIQWLIHNRTENDEMEPFVMAIPGSFTSKWGTEVWRNVSKVMQYEGAISGPNDSTVGSRTDADVRILPVPPHHGSLLPQQPSHLRSPLRPLGRIIGIRPANVTPREVTMTWSIPHVPRSGQAPDNPHATGDFAIYDLCKRVRRLLDTCNDRSLFENQELWRKRARGCVETVASLMFCADIKVELFGDLGRLLRELGNVEKIRELSAAGSDGSFVARWTCLSLIVTRGMVETEVKAMAAGAINSLSSARREDAGEQTNNGDDDENALKNARRVDNYFSTAMRFFVHEVVDEFRPGEAGTTDEQAREVLARWHKNRADVSLLERIPFAVNDMKVVDRAFSSITHWVRSITPGLIAHLPGASFEAELIQPIRFFSPSVAEGQTFTPQFIFLLQRLRLLCSYAQQVGEIFDGDNYSHDETLKSLRTLWDAYRGWSIFNQSNLMERQLWRLQDLRDGGGFGFLVELFFLALAQLLSTASSRDSDTHLALYIGTFRAITSNWRQHERSIGTQRVILNLICDVAIPGRGMFSNRRYPRYIADELLVLAGNMVEGQSGSHIDDAMEELDDATKKQDADLEWSTEIGLFRAEVVRVISRSRAPAVTL